MSLYHEFTGQFKEDKIRWVKPANLHITLKFLGETDEEKLTDIIRVLESISSGWTIPVFVTKVESVLERACYATLTITNKFNMFILIYIYSKNAS